MNLHQATLPIDSHQGLHMDAKEARQLGNMLNGDYANASPFPHIVIDGFFPAEVIAQARSGFPATALQSDRVFEEAYAGHHKRQVLPEECNAPARELFHFMNSLPLLQFLEGLTGIQGLIPDPYYVGGGYHEISRGGLLGVHADFRIHNELNLERRLNLLLYLNDPWDTEAWGGELELWDRKMTRCESRVAPLLNRCVVFSTDADSYHGHPDPLRTPEGVTRRSMALYYYTASRSIYREVPNLSTMYQARPGESSAARKQAWWMRFDQQLQDWVPPRLARFIVGRRRRLMNKDKVT
jgi:2OG-Fe(II) oxygenase superfamily